MTASVTPRRAPQVARLIAVQPAEAARLQIPLVPTVVTTTVMDKQITRLILAVIVQQIQMKHIIQVGAALLLRPAIAQPQHFLVRDVTVWATLSLTAR